MKKTIELKVVDLQSFLGVSDSHLRLIENSFSPKIVVRGQEIHVEGEENEISQVQEVFHEMAQTLARKRSLTKTDVQQIFTKNVQNHIYKTIFSNIYSQTHTYKNIFTKSKSKGRR